MPDLVDINEDSYLSFDDDPNGDEFCPDDVEQYGLPESDLTWGFEDDWS